MVIVFEEIVDFNVFLVEILFLFEFVYLFEEKDDFLIVIKIFDGKIVLGDKEWVYLLGLKESFKV